jgi:hypothetical protein
MTTAIAVIQDAVAVLGLILALMTGALALICVHLEITAPIEPASSDLARPATRRKDVP